MFADKLAGSIFMIGLLILAAPRFAAAEEDARTKQLRLLCAQLSGDLTEPGGIAAFRRCLTQDPLSAMRRNAFGTAETAPQPPQGYGRNTRTAVASVVAKFQAIGEKIIYVLTTDGKLWRQNSGSNDSKMIDAAVAEFQALDATNFYALGPDGKLWHEAGDASSRRWVDAEVAAFQPLDDKIIYVLGRDARLWRETGDMHNRVLVDSDVAAFQAIDAAIVYIKSKDGKLWRVKGTKADRLQIASDVIDFRVEGEATFIVTSAANALWRKIGDDAGEQVAAGLSAFQPVGAHCVYALAADGRLWVGAGKNARYDFVDADLLLQAGTRPWRKRCRRGTDAIISPRPARRSPPRPC
jgi:hypothetical protein